MSKPDKQFSNLKGIQHEFSTIINYNVSAYRGTICQTLFSRYAELDCSPDITAFNDEKFFRMRHSYRSKSTTIGKTRWGNRTSICTWLLDQDRKWYRIQDSEKICIINISCLPLGKNISECLIVINLLMILFAQTVSSPNDNLKKRNFHQLFTWTGTRGHDEDIISITCEKDVHR